MEIKQKVINSFEREYLLKLKAGFSFQKEDPVINRIGYLTKDQFLKIAKWKTERPTKWYETNESEFIEEVTKVSFNAQTERLKIEALRLLNGVDYPVASAILHFGCDPAKYPIIDFRTIWSLYGIENRQMKYDFMFWDEYRINCLTLAAEHNMSIRELDKALWQHSKENQS